MNKPIKIGSKPVVKEAIRYRTIRGELDAFCPNIVWKVIDNYEIPFVKTLEGEMRISNGDYLIEGIKGEFYLCKLDIIKYSYAILDE